MGGEPFPPAPDDLCHSATVHHLAQIHGGRIVGLLPDTTEHRRRRLKEERLKHEFTLVEMLREWMLLHPKVIKGCSALRSLSKHPDRPLQGDWRNICSIDVELPVPGTAAVEYGERRCHARDNDKFRAEWFHRVRDEVAKFRLWSMVP